MPDEDANHVAVLAGLRKVPCCEEPSSLPEVSRHAVTVYFETLPAKQWLVEVTSREGSWRAVRIGSKRV